MLGGGLAVKSGIKNNQDVDLPIQALNLCEAGNSFRFRIPPPSSASLLHLQIQSGLLNPSSSSQDNIDGFTTIRPAVPSQSQLEAKGEVKQAVHLCPVEVAKNNVNLKKIHQCYICWKYFNNKTNLERHMVTHSGAKPFQCSFCHQRFSRSANMRRHELIHKGIKAHVCPVCPDQKRFRTSSNLKNHMLLHSGTKEHACPFCPRKFLRKWDLKEHIRVHHMNIRLHECEHCGKRFSKASQMREHSFIHTGEKPFKCELCGKFFRRKGDLRRHVNLKCTGVPQQLDIVEDDVPLDLSVPK